MTVEKNHDLGRRFFKAQDRLRGGPDAALCAPTYTARINGNPPLPLPGHQEFGKLFYAAFPDIFHTIDETIADEDHVVVRFTLRGTHQNPFMGIPPTGRGIEVSAIAILAIEEGRVTQLRAVFDQAGMMQQLGVG